MTVVRNLIAGEWVVPASGEHIDVVDPSTDEVIAAAPRSDERDVDGAVGAAAASFPEWSQRTASERSRLLKLLTAAVERDAERLASTISGESGKPIGEARAEVAYGLGFLEWAAEEAKRIYGETIPSSRVEQRILVLRQPVGVSAAITPWNFPFAMLTRKLGPALAVGCTQVIKPAVQTPLTAVALCELAVEVGIPAGVVNLVMGPGPVLGTALLADARVRKLSFTGSTEVGQELVRKSAANLTRLSLELGGHAPVVVLSDADLDVAVSQSLRAKFRNAGQSCISANRFYVARALYEDFCAAFADAVARLTVGRWSDDPDIGPLVDDRAVEKVLHQIDDAVSHGAKILCGGGLLDLGSGYANRFVEPTVLHGVDDGMLISTEETFGPVAGISPIDSDEEGIRRANDSRYGLAAYVFGADLGRLVRVVERLDYGVIGVNDGVPSTAQAPFGGMKLSGFGREGGRYVMNEYLDTKYVSLGI